MKSRRILPAFFVLDYQLYLLFSEYIFEEKLILKIVLINLHINLSLNLYL